MTKYNDQIDSEWLKHKDTIDSKWLNITINLTI